METEKSFAYLWDMNETQTHNTMSPNLSTRISGMTTSQIKEVLETMNRKPSTQWTKEEMTVENACIFELLFVRELKGWVEEYEARMS